jgi:UDP-N-acetylmuramoylalanine--D-glutamate ligase
MTTPATIDPDALTIDSIRTGGLRGRPVTVLGLARSGLAVARFLTDVGARVTVYDGRSRDDLAPAISDLGGRDVRLMLGPDQDPAATWADAALVVTSPSITPDFPTTEAPLRAALRELVAARAGGDRGAPALLSEADLFLRLCEAPTVGITGTKGKTTTSARTAAVLAADLSHRVVMGGNMGTPIVERLPDLTPDDRVVFELSELQLPTLSRGTTVAVVTNVTSDHLDRHGTVAAYQAVKRRLAELVDPTGALVLNGEDPVVAGYADLGTARTVTYRRQAPTHGGVGVVDGWIVADEVERLGLAGGGYAEVGPDGRIMPVDVVRLPGAHNLSNALAAVSIGLIFGVPTDGIAGAVAAFAGVEHRLETVVVIDGVRYVNDSQGTQPDAVVAALRAFDPPIVLIAGGRDKDVDLTDLPPVVVDRAVAAVLIGESGPDLARRFQTAGLSIVEHAGSMDEAVERADALARASLTGGGADVTDRIATVLLSPSAASFDMFTDYEDRGRAFKAAVTRLTERRRRDHP